MGVTKESFGFLEDKREAFLYTIENQNGFAVKVTDFGVNIVSLLVKNKEGNIKDVAFLVFYKERNNIYSKISNFDCKSILMFKRV